MLIDASLPVGWPRRPLGWVAALGTTVALWSSLWQLSLPAGTGFFGTVETSPFTVFFHVLICGIVLVALLLSLDTLPEDSHHQGEYYALIVFGAVGMCLLTSAVELLVVFIALEISSISTYILAGYRKHTGRGPEAAIKYFLLGSFATAFLLYGIALIFGATGTTQIYEIAARVPGAQNQTLDRCRAGPHAGRNTLQGLRRAVPRLDARCLRRRALAGRRADVHRAQGRGLRAAAARRLRNAAHAALHLGAAALDRRRALHDRRQSRRAAPAKRQAHAGLLLDRARRVPAGRLCRAWLLRNRRRRFYTAAYAAMNVGIFAVVTLVSGYDEKLPLIHDFRGLIYRSPLLGSLLIFFLISLIGIPFTGGFFGKFYSFSAAVGGGAVMLAIIGLLNSGVAAAYYLRLAFAAAQRPDDQNGRTQFPLPQVGIAVGAALLFTVGATLALGIVPGKALHAAETAAHTLQVPHAEESVPEISLQPQPR